MAAVWQLLSEFPMKSLLAALGHLSAWFSLKKDLILCALAILTSRFPTLQREPVNILPLLLPFALGPHWTYHPVHALCLLQKPFSGVMTIAYRIFPGCELKTWNLLLQFVRSHLFPNEMKYFMLWLGSFRQRHHAAIERCTKLGKEAGLGAVNLLHTLQSGGQEGDCCLPEGSWGKFCSVSLYVPKVHGWASHMALSGNTNSNCFALLEIYMATNPGEQHFTMALVKLWMCGTILGCLNSQLSEKFCKTENSDSRCCYKL